MDTIDHASWLGFALDKALGFGLTQAEKLLPHLTPETIVAQLPAELTTKLITGALATGKLTPESLLEVAPPAVLAKHIEPGLLWRCVCDVATTHKLDTKGAAPASDGGRRWLAEILRQALDARLVTPAEVVRHVPPAEWVRDAPLAVVAEMIRAGLTKGAFNPELALAHLTPKVIAEKLQPSLSWSCIHDALSNILELTGHAADQTGETAALPAVMSEVAKEAAPPKEAAKEAAPQKEAAKESAPRETAKESAKPAAAKPAKGPEPAAKQPKQAEVPPNDAIITSARVGDSGTIALNAIPLGKIEPVAVRKSKTGQKSDGFEVVDTNVEADDPLDFIDDAPLPPPPPAARRA